MKKGSRNYDQDSPATKVEMLEVLSEDVDVGLGFTRGLELRTGSS